MLNAAQARSLTDQEMAFCDLFLATMDPEGSARQAGYEEPLPWPGLLADPEIQDALRDMIRDGGRATCTASDVLDGLLSLARDRLCSPDVRLAAWQTIGQALRLLEA